MCRNHSASSGLVAKPGTLSTPSARGDGPMFSARTALVHARKRGGSTLKRESTASRSSWAYVSGESSATSDPWPISAKCRAASRAASAGRGPANVSRFVGSGATRPSRRFSAVPTPPASFGSAHEASTPRAPRRSPSAQRAADWTALSCSKKASTSARTSAGSVRAARGRSRTIIPARCYSPTTTELLTLRYIHGRSRNYGASASSASMSAAPASSEPAASSARNSLAGSMGGGSSRTAAATRPPTRP